MMLRILAYPVVAAVLVLPSVALAIPERFSTTSVIGGDVVFLPEDQTAQFLDEAKWDKGQLPGDWSPAKTFGETGQLITRTRIIPKLFGAQPAAILAGGQDGRVEQVSVVYLDPDAYSGKDSQEVRNKQKERKQRYEDLSPTIRESLKDLADDSGDPVTLGETPGLRSKYLDFEIDGFTVRLAEVSDYSISLLITRDGDAPESFLDTFQTSLKKSERRDYFEARVKTNDQGDRALEGMSIFPQGPRPYCGVATLTMATHYLGLRLSTDYLASRAGFSDRGSAAGTNFLELYRAAAEEAGASVQRSTAFDPDRASRGLDDGMPVIVWRRFSERRDKLHRSAVQPGQLPEPSEADRSEWATDADPAHASVVIGRNEEAGEVLLLESWGDTRVRRIRVEELEATSYKTFYFRLD